MSEPTVRFLDYGWWHWPGRFAVVEYVLVKVRVSQERTWPLPHDEFHHTPRCNTGGCHD